MTVADELSNLLGPKGWVTGAEASPWQRDWLNRFGAAPLGVARPVSTAQVSAVLAACHRSGVPVVPQGGNTGLCGGAVLGRAGGVILSLSRMVAMGVPDLASGSVLAESGLVLDRLHQALDGSGMMLPLHLGSEGSAQIGGLIGTNAGGSHAFRFGMMADLVLGLEVVLADGTVWDGLRAVQKDNSGYALRRLFCGSEGTLGVVTRAILRLSPVPRQRATAFLALPDHAAMVKLGTRLRADAGEFLTGLEFFSDVGLQLALCHVPGLRVPFDGRGDCYLLVEVASGSPRVPLDEILGDVLEWGLSEGLVLDGVLAASDAQRAAFWHLREVQPEGQRLEGTQLKHDLAVPPGRVAEFVTQAAVICQDIMPGVRINPFGHLADGNVHYNLTPPEGSADFEGLGPRFEMALGQLAVEMGGSFSAEHGLGRAKVAMADALRPKTERAMMARLKAAFDTTGTLNPGVLLREDRPQ